MSNKVKLPQQLLTWIPQYQISQKSIHINFLLSPENYLKMLRYYHCVNNDKIDIQIYEVP